MPLKNVQKTCENAKKSCAEDVNDEDGEEEVASEEEEDKGEDDSI